MNSREVAEKQDLWHELNDLWLQRQRRRRKGRLGLLIVLSAVAVFGALLYVTNIPAPQQALFMQIKGQRLDGKVIERSASEQSIYRAEGSVEITETITL
ncbi:MAG: hypothetical protein RBR43_01245 [Desulfuromonadaceae bacterium]|nr:hypothetical protein [Desulfuromonas sp.]MDY0184488.1 hypothetical protein [Desulfuromonadaceae bacterium]